MNIEDMLEINDCPLCDGGALLEEECGCGYYVMCLECAVTLLRLIFTLKKSGWKQRKERLCFGIPAR